MRTDSRELLAVGMFGNRSRLGERIEMLLRRGRTFSTRASVRGVAASIVALSALLLAGSLAPRWIAFAQEAGSPSFEVASVKANQGGARSMRANPEGIHYTGVTLIQCVAEAYQVNYSQIDGHQTIADRSDIEAKAARAITKEQSRQMLQTLLAERFKLQLHHVARTMPVYRLVAGESGHRLGESSSEADGSMVRNQDGFQFRGMSMYLFSAILSGRLGRPVLDQTGIKGSFDFTLALDLETPGEGENKGAASDWSSSPIFAEIQKQLGLRLQADRAPVDFLVIDHAEKPDAN
jgi:uncharacterized protein (TIGR03435 family)